jgi:hypothetical protein
MVLALIATLLVTCVTGVMQTTYMFFGVTWVENVHHYAANALLVLVPLHVAGAVLSSLMHRENLIGAMITGRKPAVIDGHRQVPVASGLPRWSGLARPLAARQGLPVLAIMLVGGLGYGWVSTGGRTTEPAPIEIAAEPTGAGAVRERPEAAQLAAEEPAKARRQPAPAAAEPPRPPADPLPADPPPAVEQLSPAPAPIELAEPSMPSPAPMVDIAGPQDRAPPAAAEPAAAAWQRRMADARSERVAANRALALVLAENAREQRAERIRLRQLRQITAVEVGRVQAIMRSVRTRRSGGLAARL